MTLKEKTLAAERESKRLAEIFKNLDANKLALVNGQIKSLAWFNVSAAELKQSIDAAGTSIGYDNGGGQRGVRINPDIKTLCDYQKHITAITKQLLECLPAGERESEIAKAIALLDGTKSKVGK